MPTSKFEPAVYGPVVARILGPELRLADLGPGSPVAAVKDGLERFDPLKDLGRPVVDADAARACHAGLWLLFDYLDESHTISQGIESPDGSFWHAVMHRREPDVSNSKYWWKRVGTHPVLRQLVKCCNLHGEIYTTPEDFVDFCDWARGTNGHEEQLAKMVQRTEWRLQFDHCYRRAVGA